MKKKNTIIFTVLIIILISLFIGRKNIFNLFKHSNINGTINKECDHKPKLYYELEERKIYSYCLDEIKVRAANDDFIELKDYLKNNNIDDFIKLLELESSFDDGGTAIYRDGGTKKYTKGELTIIRCNKIWGTRDIYIGPKNMEFKHNFCIDNNYTFVKTYTILNIHEYKGQQYEGETPVIYSNSYEVTLINNKNEKATVIINGINNVPKKGKTYEFEFMPNNTFLDYKDNADFIFANFYLVEIRETTKDKNEQINESLLVD